MSDSKKAEMITKKDMTYVIIILILSMICISTKCFGNNQEVVSYIGFAGTIVSILLGLVAIIYSFFQTYASASVSNDLAKQSENLQKSLEKAEIENEKFRAKSEMVLQKVDEFSGNLSNLVSSKFDENKQLLEKISSSMKTDSEATENQSSDTDYASNIGDELVCHIIEYSSNYGAIALLIAYVARKNDLLFNMPDSFKEMRGIDYIYGYFMALSAIGIIDFEYISDGLKIAKIHPAVESELAKKIASFESKEIIQAKESIINSLRMIKPDINTSFT